MGKIILFYTNSSLPNKSTLTLMPLKLLKLACIHLPAFLSAKDSRGLVSKI
jgi:hypothetical protein